MGRTFLVRFYGKFVKLVSISIECRSVTAGDGALAQGVQRLWNLPHGHAPGLVFWLELRLGQRELEIPSNLGCALMMLQADKRMVL